MPSLSEIANHLRLSKARAGQLKQDGMPTTTLRAAKLWRDNQSLKRAPTNGANKGQPVTLTANLQSSSRAPRRPRRSPATTKPAQTDDSLADALTDAIAITNTAFDAYEDARFTDSPTRFARLSDYSKTLDCRLKAQKAHWKEADCRSILVPKAAIIEPCRRAIHAMLKRLKKLPAECGPLCNEQEPLRAVAILQRAVDEILLTGQKALRDP